MCGAIMPCILALTLWVNPSLQLLSPSELKRRRRNRVPLPYWKETEVTDNVFVLWKGHGGDLFLSFVSVKDCCRVQYMTAK